MEKQIYKILPNGKPSGLSLNNFKIYHNYPNKWNGYYGNEIYSLKLFKEKFFNIYPQFKNDSQFDILEFLQKNSDKEDVKKLIEEIACGISDIILALKEASEECIKNNKNLFQDDWSFWKNCQYIVFAGKITEGKIGNEFLKAISSEIVKLNMKIINLSNYTNGKTPSLVGLANKCMDDNQFIFDFGSTTVKRGIAKKNGEMIDIIELDQIKHLDFNTLPENIESAKYIDDFIFNVILETIYQFKKKENKNFSIRICISNNIINNKISNRGSYRNLQILAENYCEYISNRFFKEFNKSISVEIYNDIDAIGKIFNGLDKEISIISFGTSLGIGYSSNY